MTDHPSRSGKFELVFWGSISKRHRRWHSSFESAQELALEILASLPNRAAHPAIVYGPGCGRDGVTIA